MAGNLKGAKKAAKTREANKAWHRRWVSIDQPPKDCTHENKRYVGSVPWCIDCGKTLAATELVEPIPHAQCPKCGNVNLKIIQNPTHGLFVMCPTIGCYTFPVNTLAAASSPAARPQTVETYDCDCDDLLCRDNRYCTSPAARVEQPAPPLLPIIICGECKQEVEFVWEISSLGNGQFRYTTDHYCPAEPPAAPVVAQRPDRAECALSPVSEHGSIAREDSTMQEYQIIFHVTTDNTEFADQWRKKALSILDKHQAELMPDTNADIGAFCSGHVAASQRTEGEGQK